MPTSPRPFVPADQAGVNALHRSVWWPERSPGGWRWLDANPARQDIDAPAGWVVEDKEGQLAAFLGNMIQRFWKDGQVHFGATGYSTIVTPAARGASRSLFKALLAQPGLFACYTFNANPRSAPLYARQGLSAWPPRTHALKLSWIVDPVACLRARLLRAVVKHAPKLTNPYRERFLSSRLGTARRGVLPTGVEILTDLSDGSDYADFWARLKAGPGLIADRSPEILRWRLADPDQTLAPALMAYRRDGAITGYAMGLIAKASPIEPPVLEIIDLIAVAGETEAVPALMDALIAHAWTQGAAKVRLQAMGDTLLSQLGAHARRARREGGWGHCHARFAPDAPSPLDWSPTPFDGDYGICQRPTPVPPRPARSSDPIPARSRASKA